MIYLDVSKRIPKSYSNIRYDLPVELAYHFQSLRHFMISHVTPEVETA
jgi:hypothetical protein